MKSVQSVPARSRKVPTARSESDHLTTTKPEADFALDIISASVPRRIVTEVKKRVGKRGFSQFVTRSLERELQRENQRSFIAEAEAAVGPIEAKSLARAERLLRS